MSNSAPCYLIADGSLYRPEEEYYFWHPEIGSVRSSDEFLRVRGWLVDTEFNREIVPIGQLHRSRDAAIEDGQRQTLRRIEELKALIQQLENQKSPAKRTLKYRQH